MVLCTTPSYGWIWLAEQMLYIFYCIFGVPNIRRLERLLTTVLNVIHDTVCHKANRIQGTLLVNPATIPGFADVIVMLVQKSL